MEKRYEIGNFIYQLRTERGYTQKELGALLGVTDKAVSKWETGAATPRRAVLQRLSVILGCTQEELFLGRRIEKTAEAQKSGPRAISYEAEISGHEELSTVFSEKTRVIIWKVELCVLLVLALLVAIFGFNRGIWDGTTFYGVSEEGNKRVYTGKSTSAVEISTEAGQSEVDIYSKEGQTARLLFQLSQNGSFKTALILSEDGSTVMSSTYSDRGERWDCPTEGNHVISDHIWKTDHFTPGISDQAICRMALGLEETRIMGRGRDFFFAAVFLTLGLSFRFLTNAMIELDKKILGLFYKNTEGLRADGVAQGCLAALGIALFVIGLIMCWSVLRA